MVKTERAIFSTFLVLQNDVFSLVAEALTGLIYHRPLGENFSFQERANNVQAFQMSGNWISEQHSVRSV